MVINSIKYIEVRIYFKNIEHVTKGSVTHLIKEMPINVGSVS